MVDIKCYVTRSPYRWFQVMLVCAVASMPQGYECKINYVHHRCLHIYIIVTTKFEKEYLCSNTLYR